MIATAASKAASSRALCVLRSSAVAGVVGPDSVPKPSAARLARSVALMRATLRDAPGENTDPLKLPVRAFAGGARLYSKSPSA